MVTGQLVEHLKQLNKKTLDELLRFARAGVLTDAEYPQYAADLIEKVISYGPDYDHPDLDKDALFPLVFPQKGVAKSRLDKAISDAHKIVRRFVLYKAYGATENELGLALDLATWYRKNNLAGRYENAMDKARQQLEAMPKASADYLKYAFLIEWELHEFMAYSNKGKGDVNILNTIFSLDQFYCHLRLQLINRLASQNLYTKCIETSELQKLQSAVNFSFVPIEDNALLKTLLTLNELFKDNSQLSLDAVDNLFAFIREHYAQFDPLEVYHNLAYLNNLVTRAYNSDNDRSWLYPKYRINRFLVENRLNFLEGKLGPATYLTIARNALLVGEKAWADEFIETYKGVIHNESEDGEFYRTTRAMYLCFSGSYQEALDILPQNVSQYSFYYMIYRRVEVIAYYELQSDLLPYKIDAFKSFVSRYSKNVLTEETKRLNNNFINAVQLLSSLPKGDKKAINDAFKRINAKTPIAEVDWIREKMREISPEG